MSLISHSAINSPIFKLIDAFQFDVFFEDDGYTLRVELFQDMDDENAFRCSFWQVETVEVSVYVSDGHCLKPDRATYHIPVDWSAYLKGDYSLFKAESPQIAIKTVFEDIRQYLAHASNSED